MKHAIVITLKTPPVSELALLQTVLALNECRVAPEALLFQALENGTRRSIWLIVSGAVNEATVDRLRELPDVEEARAVACEEGQLLPWPPLIVRAPGKMVGA